VVLIDVIVRRILISRIYEGHGFRRAERESALIVKAPAPEADLIVPEMPPDILADAESVGRQVA
jgi:hypothetical protein